MQLDDLKTTWKEELQMQEKMTDFDKIRRNVDKYDKRIKMTWAIELLACIGVVLVIAFAWFNKITTQAVHPLFHLGSLAVVLACAFVG